MKLFRAILIVSLGASFFGCKKGELPKETTPTQTPTENVLKDSKEEKERIEQEEEKQKKLLEAIQVYRDSKKKMEAGETPAFEQAWNTIIEAGEDGVGELKKELKKVELLEDGDEAFETAASLMIFEVGGLDEAEAVAEIWNRIPQTINYNGIFSAALKAAKSKDPRALPMLKACLTSQKGSVFVILTGAKLFWPNTHEVLWGVYGPKGLQALLDTLKETKNTVVQRSAIRILTAAGYLDALDEVRRLSKYGIGAVQLEAIRALGTFGHPDDFNALAAGLSSTRTDEVVTSIYALLNFEDVQATESILPLAESDNERIKKAALTTISYLLTPESLKVLKKCSKKEKNQDIKKQCKSHLDAALQKMAVSYKKFSSQSGDGQNRLVLRAHRLNEESYTIKPDDQHLTREQFEQTIKEWKDNTTIQRGTLDWVRTRHILDIATPEDIELLLFTRSVLQTVLTQGGLRDVGLVNEMIKHLSRRRYRNPTGIIYSVQ